MKLNLFQTISRNQHHLTNEHTTYLLILATLAHAIEYFELLATSDFEDVINKRFSAFIPSYIPTYSLNTQQARSNIHYFLNNLIKSGYVEQVTAQKYRQRQFRKTLEEANTNESYGTHVTQIKSRRSPLLFRITGFGLTEYFRFLTMIDSGDFFNFNTFSLKYNLLTHFISPYETVEKDSPFLNILLKEIEEVTQDIPITKTDFSLNKRVIFLVECQMNHLKGVEDQMVQTIKSSKTIESLERLAATPSLISKLVLTHIKIANFEKNDRQINHDETKLFYVQNNLHQYLSHIRLAIKFLQELEKGTNDFVKSTKMICQKLEHSPYFVWV